MLTAVNECFLDKLEQLNTIWIVFEVLQVPRQSGDQSGLYRMMFDSRQSQAPR